MLVLLALGDDSDRVPAAPSIRYVDMASDRQRRTNEPDRHGVMNKSGTHRRRAPCHAGLRSFSDVTSYDEPRLRRDAKPCPAVEVFEDRLRERMRPFQAELGVELPCFRHVQRSDGHVHLDDRPFVQPDGRQ